MNLTKILLQKQKETLKIFYKEKYYYNFLQLNIDADIGQRISNSLITMQLE